MTSRARAARGRVVGFLTALTALTSSCAEPQDARARGPANVLLITVDTLRADHLGAYGYELDVSPHIDALAEAGVRFADVTVQWPKTSPSIASLLTGRYPRSTGIRLGPRLLPKSLDLLAEIFSAAGYETAAVVANFNVGRRMGFEQGFDTFVESWQEGWRQQSGNQRFINAPGRVKEYTNATIVTDQALRWLSQRKDRTPPFFLWIHYMDPHGPYRPPAAYASLFENAHTYERVAVRRLPAYQRQSRDGRIVANLGFYRAQYDREIRYVDDEIGRLLGSLGGLDVADPLIVLTADHGESLGEQHYYLEHGKLPYQSTAHVPLIVARRGVIDGGRTIDAPVGLIDLSPTLLDLAGLPVPPSFEGTSLAAAIREAPEAPLPAHVFMESGYHEKGTQLTVRAGPWKLVHVPLAADRQDMKGQEYELYHLGEDPGETRNVAARRPEVVERLRTALDRWQAAGTGPGEVGEPLDVDALDPASREMLRDLGYLEEE